MAFNGLYFALSLSSFFGQLFKLQLVSPVFNGQPVLSDQLAIP